MRPTASITATQTAGAVGKMVGIEAGAIKGDVHVEQISQVQIVILTSGGRGQDPHRFIDIDTRPYVSLLPYKASDEALFQGRKNEVRQIIETIQSQNLLVVYGPAGVGKTSLLAAGVSPAVAREGALPIQIQDYHHPEKTIRDGFARAADYLSLDLPEDAALPILLDRIIGKVKGTVVLILDQFELLFEPPISDDQREKFIADLAETVRTIDRSLLRLIIVTRSESLEKVGEIERQMPSLLQRPFSVAPLTREQAQLAITEPLYSVEPGTKTIFESELVEKQLVPDLDDLTENEPGIHPQHLQIVCDTLYRSAEMRGGVRVISRKLYIEELKGADGILASFMRSMMQTRIDEGQMDTALQVLALMASPGAPRWMKPTDFSLRDSDSAEIEKILRRLVEAKLVIQAYSEGKTYSLVSQMISRELRQLAGTGKEVSEKYNAEDELERIWHTWLALEHFASREQLRYLSRAGGHLEPRAVKTLLMLRSAVEADTERGIWVERLRDDRPGRNRDYVEGPHLIQLLESTQAFSENERIGRTTLVNARRLLGFSDRELRDSSTPSSATFTPLAFGPVTEKTVTAESATVRQTCALALAALGSHEAIKRVEAALQNVRGSRQRRVLRSELRGTLADADPEVVALNAKLSLAQRIFIWKWRASRRIARDRRRLVRMSLGGALGAGLAVGLLRACLAMPTDNPLMEGEIPGQEFWWFFFLTALLAASLCAGITLARLIQPLSHQAPADFATQLKRALLSVALGTAFFGVVHAVQYWFNGGTGNTIGAGYIILMGFAMGFGLSLALSFSLSPKRFPVAANLALRVVVAAVTFVLVDQFFVLVHEQTDGVVLMTQITRSRDVLRALAGLAEPPLRLRLFTAVSGDAQILTMLHAAFTGMFMMTGLSVGLRQADRPPQKQAD